MADRPYNPLRDGRRPEDDESADLGRDPASPTPPRPSEPTPPTAPAEPEAPTPPSGGYRNPLLSAAREVAKDRVKEAVKERVVSEVKKELVKQVGKQAAKRAAAGAAGAATGGAALVAIEAADRLRKTRIGKAVMRRATARANRIAGRLGAEATENGLARNLGYIARKNPIYRFLIDLFPVESRPAVAACCGCCSGCGCGASCCAFGTCVLPIVGMVILAGVLYGLVFGTPTPILVEACYESDPVAAAAGNCEDIGPGFDITVAGEDFADEDGPSKVATYRDLERAYGIPWFYLMAWEKVATDFGRLDYRLTTQLTAPSDISSVTIEAAIAGAKAQYATDTGEEVAQAEITAAEQAARSEALERVARLTAELRGGSYGLMLMNAQEWRENGLFETPPAAPITDDGGASGTLHPNAIVAGKAMAAYILEGEPGTESSPVWVAFAAQVQWENSGNIRENNPFNMTDDAARDLNGRKVSQITSYDQYDCAGTPFYAEFGQTGWWKGGRLDPPNNNELHCFAAFSTLAGGADAAADRYVRGAAEREYGYDRVVAAAKSGDLEATARAIECSSWATGRYGATCEGRTSIDPGKITRTALTYAAKNLGSVSLGGGLCSAGSAVDCTEGRPLDLWDRADAGQVLSRSMLDAFRTDGSDGTLVAPVESGLIDPGVARLVDSLISNLGAWERIKDEVDCSTSLEICGTDLGESRTTLHTIIGWNCGVAGICASGFGDDGLPAGRPSYNPGAFVLGGNLFGDGVLGMSGWAETWPASRPYDTGPLAGIGRLAKFDEYFPPLDATTTSSASFLRDAPLNPGLAAAYRDVIQGSEISLPMRLFVCQRVMRAKANGVIKWHNSFQKLDAEAAGRAVGLCNQAFPQAQATITLPEATLAGDSDANLATKLRALLGEGYSGGGEGGGAIYQPSYLNPQIGIGEEVRDWGALQAVMSSLLENPALWGNEKRAYIDGTAIGVNTDGSEGSYQRVRINAYSRAMTRYARSVYEWWSARELARRGGADPVAAARAIDVKFWEYPVNEEITRAVDEKRLVVGRELLLGTLMADGVIYDGRADAGGCRPWIGFNSLTGRIDDANNSATGQRRTYALKRFASVANLTSSVPIAGSSRPPFRESIQGLSDPIGAFSAAGDADGVDPLLLAALAWSASGYDPDFRSGNRYGLFGMTKADVDVYFPDPPEDPPANWREQYLLDPAISLQGAAEKLRATTEATGRPELAIAAFRSSINTVGNAKSIDDLAGDLAEWAQGAMDVYTDSALLFGRTGDGSGIGSSGIGGCWRFGAVQAVAYDHTKTEGARAAAINDGVAMNFCLPYLLECGEVLVTRLNAEGRAIGAPVRLPVVDYHDGDVGSESETAIALRPGAVSRLGLSGDGPFAVRVQIIAPASGASATTPYGGRDWGARWVWPVQVGAVDPVIAVRTLAEAMRLGANAGPEQPPGLNPNTPVSATILLGGRGTAKPRGNGAPPTTLAVAYVSVQADDVLNVRLDTLGSALGGVKTKLELRKGGCDSGDPVPVGEFVTKTGSQSYVGEGSNFGFTLPYPANALPNGIPVNLDVDSAKAADWARDGLLGLCVRQASTDAHPGALIYIALAPTAGGPLAANGTPGYLNFVDAWIEWSGCVTSPGGQRIEDPLAAADAKGKRPLIWVKPWCDYLGRIAADIITLLTPVSSYSGGTMIVPDGSPYGEMVVSEMGYIWPFKGGWVTSGQEYRGNYFSSLGVRPSGESERIPLHSGVDMSIAGCSSREPGKAPLMAVKDGWLWIYSYGAESALNQPPRDDGGTIPAFYQAASQILILHDDGLYSFYGHVAMVDTPVGDPSLGGAIPYQIRDVPEFYTLNGRTVMRTVDGTRTKNDQVIFRERRVAVTRALLPPGIEARFSDPAAQRRTIKWNGRSFTAVRVAQGEVIGRIGPHLGGSCHLHLEIGVAKYKGDNFPLLLDSSCDSAAFAFPFEGDPLSRWCGSFRRTFVLDALSILPPVESEINSIRVGVYCYKLTDAEARSRGCRPDYRGSRVQAGYPPRLAPIKEIYFPQ